MSTGTPRRGLGPERVAALAFLVCAGAAAALAVVYALGGQVQAEGALLLAAFGALGVGLVVVAHRLLPSEPYEEERHALPSPPEERAAFAEDFERGETVGRRRVLVGSLAAALAAIGAALVFPIRSLGPRPGNTLERTPWRRGLRLVTEEGEPVRAEAVPVGGFLTVFPDGHPGSADGQAVLVRLEPGRLRDIRGREDWAPDGLIAFSKVCTHAGCPVGLYEVETHTLLCPCHQSAFDVLDGAKPVFGPAARALPQLPLRIDGGGYVVARGDFPEPIGPSYWSRG